MKIHILFKFADGPWGGGNQFLKALREQFRHMGVYSETPEPADVILFNSYPYKAESLFWELYRYRSNNPKLAIVHRVDGPISMIRGRDEWVDRAIFSFNNIFSDGTVFQSNWSKMACKRMGLQKNNREVVILNAPDNMLFYKKEAAISFSLKTRLVAASWSANINKGFGVYSYLDKHLDFNRYEMTFVGNSPLKFHNIRIVPPISSLELGRLFRDSDVFITASKNDPCSNSLIEALACGLPAVVLKDGGHPELLGQSGVAFEGTHDIIAAIEEVSSNPVAYAANTSLPSIREVADTYYAFCSDVYAAKIDSQANLLSLSRLYWSIYSNRLLDRLKKYQND